jgi:hypothetical protein
VDAQPDAREDVLVSPRTSSTDPVTRTGVDGVHLYAAFDRCVGGTFTHGDDQ